MKNRNRPELDSERDTPKLQWHDDERIQQYVSSGHELVQKTPLGYQLECFRDNVRIQGMPDSHPPGDWGYGTHTAYHRARETALRLWDTERGCPGSVATLWAHCHPITVTLDGLPGGRGRIFPVYSLTELGRRARRSAGSKEHCDLAVERLLGSRPCKCKSGDCSCFSRGKLIRRIYAESAEAKGELREVWNEIHEQAVRLLRAAIESWQWSRQFEDERRRQKQDMRRHGARSKVVTTATSDG